MMSAFSACGATTYLPVPEGFEREATNSGKLYIHVTVYPVVIPPIIFAEQISITGIRYD